MIWCDSMHRPDLPQRYRVLSLLGEGSSGRVYRVFDSVRGHELACKLVGSAESTWLRREFDALRQIRHENLISVFDWASLREGEAYYTMEMVEGGDISSRLSPSVSQSDLLVILAGILRGIAHLHCHGEIHGDLKPSNVLLDRGGSVKITDVGMGRHVGQASTMSGTPGHTAPEVWAGGQGDERSDIYSVGVIAYEALTGHHPFAGRTVREVIGGQLEGWVRPTSSHKVVVPAYLERAVMRALERDPSLRQPTADEFMEELHFSARVGEILGGKFVNRSIEMESLSSYLDTPSPVAPSLAWISGASGSGRMALAKDWSHRMSENGARVLELNPRRGASEGEVLNSVLVQLEPAEHKHSPAPGAAPTLESVSQALAKAAAYHPILVIADTRSGPDDDFGSAIRALGRYAHSTCSGLPLLILGLTDSGVREIQEFERLVHLRPFTKAQVGELVVGLLGKVRLDDGAVARLHGLTGGSPGLAVAAILELIAQGVLLRTAGRWNFRETVPIDTLQIVSIGGPFALAWPRLAPDERELLIAVALVTDGIFEDSLALAFGPGSIAILDHHANRGWLVNERGSWHLASEGLRRQVVGRATDKEISEVAERLVQRGAEGIGSEGTADLLLLAGEAAIASQAALEAAMGAASRGQHGLAARRLSKALDRGRGALPRSFLQRVSLALAEELNAQGIHMEAAETLTDNSVWGEGADEAARELGRSHLLGQLYRSVGDSNAAKAWFEKAGNQAKAVGDLSMWLRAHADTAQIEWELGTEAERTAAAARIHGVLAEIKLAPGLDDERAMLTYGLGASLVWAGDREGAKRVLGEGMLYESSPYWKMRIAIAMGSACMGLGEYTESLEWYERAWELAEQTGTDAFKARILGNRGATLHSLGRYRESAEQDLLSVEWARKAGNRYEYEAGLAGAAINNLLLARYEEALEQLTKARQVGERHRNEKHIAKTLELLALAWYFLGDYSRADQLAIEGGGLVREYDYVEIGPRLDWARARALFELGMIDEALGLLRQAEAGLRRSGDMDDLLGVQVEGKYIASLTGQAGDALLSELRALINRSRDAGVLLAELSATVAFGEVVAKLDAKDGHFAEILREGLSKAENSGVLEIAWRLDQQLGLLAHRSGDGRAAHAHLNRALMTIREISGRLRPEHRDLYLQSSRIKRGLAAIQLVV